MPGGNLAAGVWSKNTIRRSVSRAQNVATSADDIIDTDRLTESAKPDHCTAGKRAGQAGRAGRTGKI